MTKAMKWFKSAVVLAAAAFGLSASADNWIDHAADSFATQDDSAKTITIATAEQLALLAKQLQNPTLIHDAAKTYAEGGIPEIYYYAGYTITLTADINLTGKQWTPIGSASGAVPNFCGHVDGGNHVITGLWVEGESNVGLFGCIGYCPDTPNPLLIENLTIDGATVTGAGERCGILAGQVGGGQIRNVTVKNSTLSGAKYVAGIAPQRRPTPMFAPNSSTQHRSNMENTIQVGHNRCDACSGSTAPVQARFQANSKSLMGETNCPMVNAMTLRLISVSRKIFSGL